MTNLHLAEHQIVQSAGSIVSDMDGEKVMFSVSSGKYYNLGRIGGRVWELIASPTTVDRLVDDLMTEYDIDRATCQEQVVEFLENLRKEALIEVRDVEA